MGTSATGSMMSVVQGLVEADARFVLVKNRIRLFSTPWGEERGELLPRRLTQPGDRGVGLAPLIIELLELRLALPCGPWLVVGVSGPGSFWRRWSPTSRCCAGAAYWWRSGSGLPVRPEARGMDVRPRFGHQRCH